MFVTLGKLASRCGWGWTYETILFIMLLHPYMIKKTERREIGTQTGEDTVNVVKRIRGYGASKLVATTFIMMTLVTLMFF